MFDGIPFCGIYEQQSQRTGKRYFVGKINRGLKLLILENTRPEGEHPPPLMAFLVPVDQPQPPPDGQQPPSQQPSRERGSDRVAWPIAQPQHGNK